MDAIREPLLRLLTHLDLGGGEFQSLVVLSDSPERVEECIAVVERSLGKTNEQIHHLRPSTGKELHHLCFSLRNIQLGPNESVVMVTLLPPAGVDVNSWNADLFRGFAGMNMIRNPFSREMKAALIFLGTREMQAIFRSAAPDFWDIRRAVIPLGE